MSDRYERYPFGPDWTDTEAEVADQNRRAIIAANRRQRLWGWLHDDSEVAPIASANEPMENQW